MTVLDTLDEGKLRQMFPAAGDRLTPHLQYIVPAMKKWQIDTPERVSAFLAQLAHESGEYRYMEEIADGSAYEGREDLGNTEKGDGTKYKGHGPIQITGRANHRAAGEALALDLVNEPELLTQPQHGTEAACWFWWSHNLNLVAQMDWFKTTTKIINGGYNGLDKRINYYNRNREILGMPPADIVGEDVRIKQYQLSKGLIPDGDVGPRTMAELLKDQEQPNV